MRRNPARYQDGDPDSRRMTFYIVDWLPPDFGAVGQYAMLFAREIAATGRRVCLIGLTGRCRETIREHEDALEVRRLGSRPAVKGHRLLRLIWCLRTNFRLIREFLSHDGARGAELVITGAPPFMLFFAVPAKWYKRVFLRYRITDFYPEVIIAHRGRPSAILLLLARMTWWLRRRVDLFEVLGEDQRRLLLSAGIPETKIILKRDPSPIHMTGQERPRAKPAALNGRLVLLYSGNYGIAHEVETVVEGYIRHHREGSGRFALWLNATGVNADAVERRLVAEEIVHARTAPGPLKDMPATLAAADVHLIALRDRFAGIVLPSKVYACIDSQRPVVFVGPQDSDVHLLCGQALPDLYHHVETGDAPGFANALECIADQMHRSAHDQRVRA